MIDIPTVQNYMIIDTDFDSICRNKNQVILKNVPTFIYRHSTKFLIYANLDHETAF